MQKKKVKIKQEKGKKKKDMFYGNGHVRMMRGCTEQYAPMLCLLENVTWPAVCQSGVFLAIRKFCLTVDQEFKRKLK